jgi:hypothetical protein
MKILFWLYDPNWTQGGTMVMHLFSKMLCDLGEDVYATLTGSVLPGNGTKILSYDDAVQFAQNNDVVTVYPEVVSGNPLNAKNVARWVLYYPGGHGTGDIIYESSELVLPYFKRYVDGTPYENNPLLTIIETRLDQFYDKRINREFDCILIKKSKFKNIEEMRQKHFDPYAHLLNKSIISLDETLHNIHDNEQLNELFNRVRYFVSFDQATYYNIMASLSGCTSIVIPTDGLNKEKLVEQMPTYKYGIAYGFNDIEWADQTRDQLRNFLSETENENIIFAKQFIRIINERFGT